MLKELLPVGRSVMVRVKSVSAENGRFVLTMKEEETPLTGEFEKLPHQLLDQYMTDVQSYLHKSQTSTLLNKHIVYYLLKIKILKDLHRSLW